MAVTGLEHIPTDGPVLLVPRHYHHFFEVLCCSFNPTSDPYPGDLGPGEKQLRQTCSDTGHYDGTLANRSTQRCSAACVNRDRAWRGKIFTAAAIRRYQHGALSDSVAVFTQGHVLVVFPEGYPNIDAAENESGGVSSV
jgi:hypothetical protein